ncbi:MAG TPA: thioredoxin family protein [Nitrospiria bacterium]|jgi:thioredoxin reductase (NADPH)|nr:thioredoxin family protein [Nitrospiria bacterium]
MTEQISLERVMDSNYDSFLQAPAGVLLFKIASCKACEEFEPIVQNISGTYHSSIRFGKVLMHVPGTCTGIKKRHSFETFPTTHFYKNGQLVQAIEGKLDEEELTRLIETHLLSSK